MDITYSQALNILKILQSLVYYTVEFKTARKLAKNCVVLEDMQRTLDILLEGPLRDRYKEYLSKLETLQYQYAEKDGIGNPIFSNNLPVVPSDAQCEYILKSQNLNAEYANDLQEYQKLYIKTVNQKLDSEFKLEKFTKEEMQQFKLSAFDYVMLKPLIEDIGE